MNTILGRLRTEQSSSLIKKIFVGYLSLVAGCANTADSVVRSASAVNQTSASQGGTLRLQSERDSLSDQTNPFGLPDLGIPPSDTAPVQKKKDTADPMLGQPSLGLDPVSSDPRAHKSQDAKDMQALLMGMANTASTTAVKDWFSAHHATAQMNVGMGEGGVRTGSFDLLVPVFDNKADDLVFTQVGIRRSNQFSEDYRTTLNMGLGYRHQVDKWLMGVNGFYDRDMTGNNERLGLGIEAWTDNLKLSANSYLRLSDWKKSPDLEDYLERPANGWDVRAEAFLPDYPQLSGKVMYEQYYGDQVSLFGGSGRQKDPIASTLGLSYTPVPLVSISADYRQGQNGLSETSMRIGLNYRIGDSWKQQLSPDQVRATKLIENARYDLVSRRNEIVLDHKKIEHGTIILPDQVDGTASTVLTFPVSLLGPSVANFSWKGTAAAYALPYGGGATASIQLPVNSSPGIQSYSLQAVGVDNTGKIIESNMMMINVEPVHVALRASKTTGFSDGVDNIDFTAQLSKSSGEALPDVDVVWSVEGQATVTESDIKTNASGMARMRLFSRFANNVKVSVGQVNGAKTETAVTFEPNETDDQVSSVSSAVPGIISDGISSTTLTATAHDSKGLPVKAGVKISWKTDLGSLSSPTSLTDEDGKATVSLTSNVAGTATVTASGVKGASSTTVAVTAPTQAIVSVVSATPNELLADGLSNAQIQATVVDAKGVNVGAGVTVSWATTMGSLSLASSLTNASGVATTQLSSIDGGEATITAIATNGSSTTRVNFKDLPSEKVSVVKASPEIIPADGATTSTLTATVIDKDGKSVPAGTQVTWSTTLGVLSSTATVTDQDGKSSVTIESGVEGTASITATATKGSAVVAVTFTKKEASVAGVTADHTSIVGDGVAVATLSAILHDAQGNPVGSGYDVSWATTAGTLSSSSSKTDASGKATISLSGTDDAIATVTAGATKGSSSIDITITADMSRATLSLSATPSTTTAYNHIELVAKLLSASGKAIPNAQVSWTTTYVKMRDYDGLLESDVFTDADGSSQNYLHALNPGSYSITATYGTHTATTPITILPDYSSTRILDLAASKSSISADGTEAVVLTATVTDGDGHLIGAGQPVKWTTSIGSLSSPTTLTDSSSQATVSFTSKDVGSAKITAAGEDSRASAKKSKSITVTTDYSVARITRVGDSSDRNPVADGSDRPFIYFHVSDNSGNDVAGIPITVTHTGVGVVQSYNQKTDTYGDAYVTITSGTAGSYSLVGTIQNDTRTINGAFVSLPVITNLNSDQSTVATDTYATLTAKVEDASGQPIQGVWLDWSTTFGNVYDQTTSDKNGYATAIVRSNSIGSAQVTASATGGSSRSTTVNFIAPAPVPHVFYISMNSNQGTADGAIIPYVMVVDQNNNPMDNVTVEFSCEGSFCKTSSGENIVDSDSGIMRAVTGEYGAGTARFSTRAPNMEGTAIFRARVVDSGVNDSGYTQAYRYYFVQ